MAQRSRAGFLKLEKERARQERRKEKETKRIDAKQRKVN